MTVPWKTKARLMPLWMSAPALGVRRIDDYTRGRARPFTLAVRVPLQHSERGVGPAVGACGHSFGQQLPYLLGGGGVQRLPVSQQSPVCMRAGSRPLPIPRSMSHAGGSFGGGCRDAARTSRSSAVARACSARPISPRR